MGSAGEGPPKPPAFIPGGKMQPGSISARGSTRLLPVSSSSTTHSRLPTTASSEHSPYFVGVLEHWPAASHKPSSREVLVGKGGAIEISLFRVFPL